MINSVKEKFLKAHNFSNKIFWLTVTSQNWTVRHSQKILITPLNWLKRLNKNKLNMYLVYTQRQENR